MNKKIKGGYGNIKPEDCPRPFDSEYNGKLWEKWDEKTVHELLDKLQEWLLEDIIISDDDGEIISIEDKGNCFYKYWIYKEGLTRDWIGYVSRKFSSVSSRMKNFDAIQKEKLQMLGSTGKQNVTMNKFILSVNHNMVESSKSIIEHKGLDIDLKDLIDFKDEDSEE